MTPLLLLACLVLAPAALTAGLVRLLAGRASLSGRRRLLFICVPTGAFLPLLPLTVAVATYDGINNAVPIALVGTLGVGIVVALIVCLPVGLALSRPPAAR